MNGLDNNATINIDGIHPTIHHIKYTTHRPLPTIDDSAHPETMIQSNYITLFISCHFSALAIKQKLFPAIY